MHGYQEELYCVLGEINRLAFPAYILQTVLHFAAFCYPLGHNPKKMVIP